MANNTQLASDSFGSGSLAAGWSPVSGMSMCQVVANVAEPQSLSTNYGQIWTGLTWPNDHTSEITVNLTQEANTYAVLLVRIQAGSFSGYEVDIVNGVAQLYRRDNGAGTLLTQTLSLTFAAGDVWTMQAAGACISVYQNNKRVLYAQDTTYTSGSPGFIQYTSVNVTHTKVLAWRGYNAVQQNGIWKKQGIVIPAIASDIASSGLGAFNPSQVLYEGGAKVLSGNVYKMWFSVGGSTTGGIAYAESTDGVSWTRYPSQVITSLWNPNIFKNGNTYYLYCQPRSGYNQPYSVYTGTDGINWSLQNSNVISPGVAWDSFAIYEFQPIDIVGGTWYAIYTGVADSSWTPSIGLATSSDGITWTKYVSNPVVASVGATPAVVKRGSTYYLFGYGTAPNQYSGASSGQNPTETVLYSSTNFTSWTKVGNVINHSQMFEDVNGTAGQAFPGGIIDTGGQAFLYTTSSPNDASAPQVYQIALAIAPATIANIVQDPQDGTSQIASDSFPGALSANWTTLTGYSALQTASNLLEATVISTNCGARYTGGTFTKDQYSEVTIATLSGAGTSKVYPAVRCQANGDCYAFLVQGASGTLVNVGIYKIVSGTPTLIGSFSGSTPLIGDVFRLAVTTGPNGWPIVSGFQNGFLLVQVEDFNNTIPSGGNPGVIINTATSVTTTQVSKWAGGNANVNPWVVYNVNGPTKPVSVTVTNSTGNSIAITSPTLDSQQGAPVAACFTDANGNELTITGGSVGAEIAAPVPVILCDTNGFALSLPRTITSNGSSIVVTAGLTGKKLAQPRPVVLTDSNGNALGALTGSGTLLAAPTPIVTCNTSGTALVSTLT